MLFSSRAVDIPVTFYRNLHRLCGLHRRDRSYPSRRCRLGPALANPRPCPADSATAAAAATTTAAAAAPKETASASAASMESSASAASMECTATMTAATQTAMATAATMAASAATAMAAASAATAMAATTAAATGQFQVLGEWGCSAVFLVKDIERRQANVEDFLFAEKD